MTEFELIHDDDPRLHTVCDPVGADDMCEVLELLPHMRKIMKDNNGCGLAAPQVGVTLRAFIMLYNGRNHICINPELLETDDKRVIGTEGCLSFPAMRLPVARADQIKVTYLTADGTRKTHHLWGFLSRIFQHELDHLDGIVFTEKN